MTKIFASLIDGGATISDAYWELVVEDVRGALSVLRPTFEKQRRHRRLRLPGSRPRTRPRYRRHHNGSPRLHQRIFPPNLLVKYLPPPKGSRPYGP